MEVKCRKKNSIFFYHKKLELFKIKEPQTLGPQLKKTYIKYLQKISALPPTNVSGSFWLKCTNFVEQRLKCSHFEGSIVPLG